MRFEYVVLSAREELPLLVVGDAEHLGHGLAQLLERVCPAVIEYDE